MLRYRDLRLVVSAYTVAWTGGWAMNVALVAYVYAQTHSSVWVGAVTVGRFLPLVVFSPHAGVIAERFERSRLMMVCDAGHATNESA